MINRITRIDDTVASVLGTTTMSISYPQYGRLGNRRREQHNIVPNHHFDFSYGYNQRYELTDVSDQTPQTRFNYQYDLTGNRPTPQRVPAKTCCVTGCPLGGRLF